MAQNQTIETFLAALPEDRQAAVRQLHAAVAEHLPAGFAESCAGNMIHFTVPHGLYPAGYHCNPEQPLPFISIASTKSHIALHHLGLYGSPELLQWFQEAYPGYSKTKLDMGKGCVRFKKPDAIPFDLIKELAQKMTPEEWIAQYESAFAPKRGAAKK